MRLLHRLHSALPPAIKQPTPVTVTEDSMEGEDGLCLPRSDGAGVDRICRALWASLGMFHTAHAHIVSSVVQLVLKCRHPLTGVEDCCTLLQALSRRTYATAPASCDDGADEESDGGSVASEASNTDIMTTRHVALANTAVDGADKNASKQFYFQILVSKEVSELAGRDVLRHLSACLVKLLKHRDDLVVALIGPPPPAAAAALKGTTAAIAHPAAQLYAQRTMNACSAFAGALSQAVFALLESAERPVSIPVRTEKSPLSRKKAITDKDNNLKGPSYFLLDQLSTDRIVQVVDLLGKLMQSYSKECIMLCRSAEHIRKVATLLKVVRDADSDGRARSNRNRSNRAARDAYSEDSDSDVVEDVALVEQHRFEEALTRLSKEPASPQCSLLFGFLAKVPTHWVANLRAWLEHQVHICASQPRGEALTLIKRVRTALAEMDTLQGAVGKLQNLTRGQPWRVSAPISSGRFLLVRYKR